MTSAGSVTLCCPYCGGELQPRDPQPSAFNILTCECGSFPVIGHVPVLKRGTLGAYGETTRRVIRLIEKGRFQEALTAMVVASLPSARRSPPWPAWIMTRPGIGRLIALGHRRAHRKRARHAAELLTSLDSRTACDMIDFYYRYPQAPPWMHDAYNHFAYRFGQPRHLVALSLATTLPHQRGPVLELASGFGHVTRALVDRAGARNVVALDQSFFPLWVARNWIAPEADVVCCDADVGLPFADHGFEAVFCVDGLHYLPRKALCVREARRVLKPGGVMVFTATRNGLVPYRDPGDALSPRAYARLFGGMPLRIVCDAATLARYLARRGPDLSASAAPGEQDEAPLISIVAGNEEQFRAHGEFAEWPHGRGRLRLNPLYVQETEATGPPQYRRRFPTVFYEEDNPGYGQYLPESVTLDPDLQADLAAGLITARLEPLLARCAVLGLPERYLRCESARRQADSTVP